MGDLQESAYEKHIREYFERVQALLGTGEIKSEEDLKKHTFRTCEFLSSCDAYCFITGQAPYSWEDIFSLELLQQYEYDLPDFILYTATISVSLAVFNRLLETDGYRFLMGDKRTLKVNLEPDFPASVEFKEHWKREAESYSNEDLVGIYCINGLLLSVYQKSETNSHIYLLEHDDPSLVWIAELNFS